MSRLRRIISSRFASLNNLTYSSLLVFICTFLVHSIYSSDIVYVLGVLLVAANVWTFLFQTVVVRLVFIIFVFISYAHIHSGGESFEFDILPLWSDIVSAEIYTPIIEDKHPFVIWILLFQVLVLLIHIHSSARQHSLLVLENKMLRDQIDDLTAINLAQEIMINGLELATDLLLDNDAAQLQIMNMILSG